MHLSFLIQDHCYIMCSILHISLVLYTFPLNIITTMNKSQNTIKSGWQLLYGSALAASSGSLCLHVFI